MNAASLQKLKQELEAQEKQEFRNTMKNKVKDRVDTRGLPPYAKLNNKGVIECQICKFTTKDQMTFFNHVKTKKHQSAVEQLNRAQSQPQTKAQVQNQPVKNGKRPATHELYADSEDFADEGPRPMPKPQQVSSLVGYQDDEDEEDIGPAPGAQPLQNVQNVGQKDSGMEKEDEEMGVGRSENKIEEDRIEEMVVEKPTAVPEGFFDQKEDAEEKIKRAEMEKTMQNYKNFMEEIKKTDGEDADEILKELQGEQPPPLEEAEQEILDKVIKQDEEEIEDAQDYISNLRKRLGVKGKTDVQADKKIEDKNDKKKEKMEDEDEDDVGAGLRWKKRGLF